MKTLIYALVFILSFGAYVDYAYRFKISGKKFHVRDSIPFYFKALTALMVASVTLVIWMYNSTFLSPQGLSFLKVIVILHYILMLSVMLTSTTHCEICGKPSHFSIKTSHNRKHYYCNKHRHYAARYRHTTLVNQPYDDGTYFGQSITAPSVLSIRVEEDEREYKVLIWDEFNPAQDEPIFNQTFPKLDSK